jgi:hypothetical protein
MAMAEWLQRFGFYPLINRCANFLFVIYMVNYYKNYLLTLKNEWVMCILIKIVEEFAKHDILVVGAVSLRVH